MIRTKKNILKALFVAAFAISLIIAFAFFMSASAKAAEGKTPIVVAIPEPDTTSYVYNGQMQSYKLTMSDYYTISNNKKINAGTYTVTVSLIDKEGCQWSDGQTDDLEYTFTIAKAPYYEIYDMTGVKFESKYVVENGKEHTLEISGELPEGITVSYSPNKYSEPGTYQIIASFVGGDENYTKIPNRIAVLSIRKGSISSKTEENSDKPTAVISSENGIDPRITALVLESVSVEKNEALLEVLEKNEEIASAYSVKLMINEATYPLGEKVTVKLLIPEEIKNKNVNVYLLKDDGSITRMDIDKKDGYAVFETERIAKFVITYDTTSFVWLWILLIIIVILIVVVTVIVMMAKVGKEENDNFNETEPERK